MCDPCQPEPGNDLADERVITDRQDAAVALLRYFLANADANDHEANDELVQEFRRAAARKRAHLPVPRDEAC
jgi:hypothetical protein